MFFRRAKPQEWTFESRLSDLKPLGFETGRDANGKTISCAGGANGMIAELPTSI